MKKIQLMPGIVLACTLPFMAVNAVAASHTSHLKKTHHATTVHRAVPSSSTSKVNINTADASALASLKGIGIKRAQAIVAYRKAHGAFKSLNDLAGVHGISLQSIVRLEKANPKRMVVG